MTTQHTHFPLKALIFDVDGTLADSERDGHLPAFNAAFRDEALDWKWDEEFYGALLRIAGGKERLHYYAHSYAPQWLATPNAADVIKRVHDSKTRHYQELLRAGRIELRPGVARLITEARDAGLRLAIATTTTPDNVSTLLQTSLGSDSLHWFEVIGAGDVVANKKPAPDIYQWVLDQLVLPPESCLAIEDSAIGLQSALRARIPTVVTTNYYTRDQDFFGALAVLPDLETTSLSSLQLMHQIRKT